MSSFDDIFQSPAEPPRNQTFDKDAWAAKKQAERKQLYDLADSTAVGISQGGDKFRDYLDVQSRFGRYSVTNALLILAQKPQATQVKSFEDWQKADVSIKRYQKHFTILEPGKEYDREDGTKGTSYEPKQVFDISQTTARVKTPPETQRDDRAILKALIHKPPVPIQTVEELPNNAGAMYDHSQGVIFVRKGMTAPDIFRNVSMEIARAELAADSPSYDRSATSFPAYCVSYMLCKRNGIDVSGYSFDRLPESIRSGDPQTIREELTRVRDTASNISGRMARALNPERQTKPRGQER